MQSRRLRGKPPGVHTGAGGPRVGERCLLDIQGLPCDHLETAGEPVAIHEADEGKVEVSQVRLTLAVMVFVGVELVAPAAGHAGEDTGRIAVHAAQSGRGTPLPYARVSVAGERRWALAPSSREQLALRPAQVAPGGRFFMFAKVPAELGEAAFPAEFLVWQDDGWRRRKLVTKPSGAVGHLTATMVDQELEAGPVPTAVFRRTAAANDLQSIVTTRISVPKRSKLTVGFSLEEWDWSDLAPVTVSIAAVALEDGAPADREIVLFEQTVEPGKIVPGWIDVLVDLSAIEGSDVHLIFRGLPADNADLLAPHVVWSAPTLIDERAGRSLPSVVVVLLDGVRASNVSAAGGTNATMPYLAGTLAGEGAVFERALTSSPETIPAQMSLLTGLQSCAHGVLSASRTLADEIETFPETLAKAGYATAAFTDGAGLAAELGFGRGFATFYQRPSLQRWNHEGTARDTLARAAAWIEQHRDEPFVVLVHSQQATPPYVPPASYLGLFRAAVDAADPASGEKVRYLRELRYVDDALRDFVARVDAASEPRRTLMVVTSGHGEEFLEHGAREHGTQVYEESIRVPLVIRGAKVRAGARHVPVVGTVDLAPTVLDMLEVESAAVVHGRSLARTLERGEELTALPRVSEAHGRKRLLAKGHDRDWRPPTLAASKDAKKLIRLRTAGGQTREEAYDLTVDPGERNDLLAAPGPPPVWLAELRRTLDDYNAFCKGSAHPATKTDTLPVSALFKLKAFGYL